MADEGNNSLSARLDRRKVVLGLTMLGAAGIAHARMPVPNRPRLGKETLDKLVPSHVGEWSFVTESGLVLPPVDALSDRIYDNLLTRIYTNPAGEMVMLLIAYNNHQDGILQIHRPEICYPAGGYSLSPTRPVEIALPSGRELPSQAFAAKGQQRSEVVLYWTRVGTRFPRRWFDQRLAVAAANLEGVIPDGLLVRVSVLGDDVSAEMPILQTFVKDFYTQSPAKLQRLLFTGA